VQARVGTPYKPWVGEAYTGWWVLLPPYPGVLCASYPSFLPKNGSQTGNILPKTNSETGV